MTQRHALEPYAQLVRSLLPRSNAINIFDALGDLVWSSVNSAGPDMFRLVAEAISVAEADSDSAGQLR